MLAQTTASLLMWLLSFASSKLRAFLSLCFLCTLVTWQREIITTQEVIILSYDKVFPEQNNLLFEFQTHMCRNYNFLCGWQLSSTNRMRAMMLMASAFERGLHPGQQWNIQWPLCVVSPAGECKTAKCKQLWVLTQWRATAAGFGCPGPLHSWEGELSGVQAPHWEPSVGSLGVSVERPQKCVEYRRTCLCIGFPWGLGFK